jgi:hypothetical protein
LCFVSENGARETYFVDALIFFLIDSEASNRKFVFIRLIVRKDYLAFIRLVFG